MRPLPERRPTHDSRLAGLIIAPSIWAVHFIVAYVIVALHCEWSPAGSWQDVRWAVGVVGAAAVAGLGIVATIAWRRRDAVRDAERGGPRQQHFLASTTAAVAGVAAFAIIVETGSMLTVGFCHG
jgi:hypothetical protein